jgi:hypothetical protein
MREPPGGGGGRPRISVHSILKVWPQARQGMHLDECKGTLTHGLRGAFMGARDRGPYLFVDTWVSGAFRACLAKPPPSALPQRPSWWLYPGPSPKGGCQRGTFVK